MELNNAKAMYQYCIDNNYGKGTSKSLSIKNFTLIEKALMLDEKVLMTFIGLYENKAKEESGNFSFAITNRRFILAQKKLIGETIKIISLDNINDITLSTGLLGTIIIDTIKEEIIVSLNKESAKLVNRKIHEVLETIGKFNKTNTISNISNADEIIKFKQLLDQGIITQEEFEKKKQELLK